MAPEDGEEGREAAPPEILRIGHYPAFEPFAFVAEGRSRGLLIEIVEAALHRIGRADYRFVPVVLDAIEAELTAGRIDAIAFQGLTEDRRATMDFSRPLIMTGGAVFTRAGQAAESDLAAYAGQIVVTPEKGPLAGSIAKFHPEVRLLTVDSYEASLDAVLDGRADLAALNFQVGIRLVNQKYRGRFSLPAAPYTRLPFAFALAKGRNGALLAPFDDAIAALEADGTIAAITRHWLDG